MEDQIGAAFAVPFIDDFVQCNVFRMSGYHAFALKCCVQVGRGDANWGQTNAQFFSVLLRKMRAIAKREREADLDDGLAFVSQDLDVFENLVTNGRRGLVL